MTSVLMIVYMRSSPHIRQRGDVNHIFIYRLSFLPVSVLKAVHAQLSVPFFIIEVKVCLLVDTHSRHGVVH